MDNLRNLKMVHVPLALRTLPEELGQLEKLSSLFIGNTCADAVPESWGNLTSLTSLTLEDAQKLQRIPGSLRCLKRLESVRMSNCPGLIDLGLEKWLRGDVKVDEGPPYGRWDWCS